MYNFNNYIKSKSIKFLQKKSVIPKIKKTEVYSFIIKKDEEETQYIIGFINKEGKIFKFKKHKPVSELTKIRKNIKTETLLPIITGFNEQYNNTIVDYINTESSIPVITEELQSQIEKNTENFISKNKKIPYLIYYDLQFKKIFVIPKKYKSKLEDLYHQYENIQKSESKIRSTLLHNRYDIISNIQKHRENYKNFLLRETKDDNEINKYKKLFNKEKKIVEQTLKKVIENSIIQKKNVIKSIVFPNKEEYILQKDKQISQLSEIVDKFVNELDSSIGYFKDAEDKKKELIKNIEAKNKLVNHLPEIKTQILDYYKNWVNWFSQYTQEEDNVFFNKNKKYIVKELKTIKEKLVNLVQFTENNEKEKVSLLQNISDIELFIQKILSEQFTEINKKHSKKIEKIEYQLSGLENDIEHYKNKLEKILNNTIVLLELSEQKMPEHIDKNVLYNFMDCKENLKQFASINNTFVRIKQLMLNLDKIKDFLVNNKVTFDYVELNIINKKDKEEYILHYQKIKDISSNIINSLNLSEIYNNENYNDILHNRKFNEINIGLCKKISNKIIEFTKLSSLIKELFSEFRILINNLLNQKLSDKIHDSYNMLPYTTSVKYLFKK